MKGRALSTLAVAGSVLALLAVGCKKSEPATAVSPTVSPSPVSPVAPAAPTPSAAAALPPSGAIAPVPAGAPMGLLQRLESEARNRPAGGLRAETVLDAMDKNGVKIVKRQQYVGAIVGAAYCMGGNTDTGTALSVCEYVDPAAAARGRELSMTRFHAVPKEIHVNKQTTLTVSMTGAKTTTPEERKRIAELFSKL